MAAFPKPTRLTVVPARVRNTTTIFVCKECDGGPDLRRDLRSAIKDDGRQGEVVTVACGCLDVCPKRASTAVIVRDDCPPRYVVIADKIEVDAELVRALVDDRVGDAVSHALG